MSATVVTILVSAIGVISGLVALYEFGEKRRRKAISWRTVDRLVLDLIKEVEDANFCPNLIVGVGRGGMIIAAMIASNMPGRIELACVDTSDAYWDYAGRKEADLRSPERLPALRDREVLIIVAELYSGLDMLAAIKYVEEQQPKAFKTLSVLAGPSACVRPHFEGKQTKHEPRAPWRLKSQPRI